MWVHARIHVEMGCTKEVYLFIKERKEDWEVLEFAKMTEEIGGKADIRLLFGGLPKGA